MSNELVQQNQNTQVAGLETVAGRMAAMGIEAGDIAPTRLHLLQPTSEAVGADKGKVGDIINTATGEVLGGLDKAVEIIPMELYKTLVTEDVTNQPPKFMKQEPLTSLNENLPWEDKENGIPVKRTHCFNFFCLLVSEIENDDASPVVVRFKSSSMQAGRQLATHLFKRAALNQLAYSQALPLGSQKQTKGKNTYAVYTIGKGRKVTEKELAAANLWSPSLSSMKQKVNAIVDGADESGTISVTPTVVTASPGDEGKF